MIINDLEYRKVLTQGVLLGGVRSFHRRSGQSRFFYPNQSLLALAESSTDSSATGFTDAATTGSFFADAFSSGEGVVSSASSAGSSDATTAPMAAISSNPFLYLYS